MNKINAKQKQVNKYNLLKLIKPLSQKEGYIKIYPNNTFTHEIVKSQLAIACKQLGYDVYTEVEFNSGGRADIVIIDQTGEGYILEVLHSEKELDIHKVVNYPKEFTIIEIKTKDFDIKNFKL